MLVNSQIALDNQKLYKQRYDAFQNAQDKLSDYYLHTIKAPQLEQLVVEQERVDHQRNQLFQQADQTLQAKLKLQRDFAMNNRQILEKQLEQRSHRRLQERAVKEIETELTDRNIQSNKQFELLKAEDEQQRKQNYRNALDTQISIKNSLKLYGNMSNVEKQFNKLDLEAYKHATASYNSMVPGLNNGMDLRVAEQRQGMKLREELGIPLQDQERQQRDSKYSNNILSRRNVPEAQFYYSVVQPGQPLPMLNHRISNVQFPTTSHASNDFSKQGNFTSR